MGNHNFFGIFLIFYFFSSFFFHFKVTKNFFSEIFFLFFGIFEIFGCFQIFYDWKKLSIDLKIFSLSFWIFAWKKILKSFVLHFRFFCIFGFFLYFRFFLREKNVDNFRKDVRLPVQLQRAMAAEAEAAREARAKVNQKNFSVFHFFGFKSEKILLAQFWIKTKKKIITLLIM